ncbi:helix-turn-helix transcriptional regulator [Streptomyces spongiae]|uniref:Helix-turn-helix transcriptional regulator n=1 Tax=Streptomyces spongiae TaxID=565072 RepID=A0A5N8XY85_9ACTN|nr:helix-turn-helix transcriptional regulator [Streptomyces spongiae]MPY64329.1 helix-turn-helix transcriptional regulator [Streptomyces spongiae]
MPVEETRPATGHSPHGVEDLCEAAKELYARALSEGRVGVDEAVGTPCLMDFGLLQPAVTDLRWLEPVSPAVALHKLLRDAEKRIFDERHREARLTEAFEPLMRLDGPRTAPAESTAITVIDGLQRINLAIAKAMADAAQELLAVQPHNGRNLVSVQDSLERDQAFLDRGGRIRTLYQHTLRHSPAVVARYEILSGDAEVRTLNEVIERLLVIDRTVAFIPASRDRSVAVEIRHPALVEYLVMVFDRLWHMAVPMYPKAVQQPSVNGITPRQRAIAALLVEGHTDTAIADRLGMNVRTARVHIAKLAATLGSESRAQLGYLIGRSGILEEEREDERDQGRES